MQDLSNRRLVDANKKGLTSESFERSCTSKFTQLGLEAEVSWPDTAVTAPVAAIMETTMISVKFSRRLRERR